MSTAIGNGQSSENVAQLVAIYRECIAKDAEAAFNDAKRSFQAECPALIKNRDGAFLKEEDEHGRKVKSAKPGYRFIDLDSIVDAIKPLLEKYGFTYDFEQEYASDVITVKCHLSHKGGHTKTTKFTGPWATNAGMSGLQKAGSATTFGQRYSLKMALGLPVGRDDDAAPTKHENPEQDDSAPKPKPRGERGIFVDKEQVAKLYEQWIVAENDNNRSWSKFCDWVNKKSAAANTVVGESEVANPASWTQALYDVAKENLP